MASSISALNILLTGSAAGLVSALAQGKEAAGSFGESVSSSFEHIGGILETVGIAISADAIGDFLKDASQRVGQLALSANELGVTTDALSRLQFAAKETGVETEALTASFAKMEVGIGKAVTEGGASAEAFERLGLSASRLKGESPDKAFSDIAQAISQIKDPAERADAAVSIFGKSGAQLLPLLNQGSAGIARMSDEADKLGVTVNAVDAATVLQANQAVSQLGDVVEGVGNQIIIQLAPTITDISERLKKWLEDGNVVKRGLDGVWTGISYGAAFVVDVLKLGEAGFDAWAGVGVGQLYLVVKAFDDLAKAGAWVLNKVFHTKVDTSNLDALADHLGQKATELLKSAQQGASDVFSGATAAKVFQYFDQVKAEADKKAADMAKNVGTGAGELIAKPQKESFKWLHDLSKAAEDGWKKVTSVIEAAAKSAEEQSKKLDEEAKSAIEKSLTPLQKEQEELKKLTDLYRSGHLTKEQFQQAKDKIEKDFDKDVKANPKAVQAGSQEAFNLINQIENSAKGLNSKDAVPQKQLETAEKTNDLLTQLLGKIGPGKSLGLAKIGVS